MARKIDPQIQENVDRGEENEQDSTGFDSRKDNFNHAQANNESDTIKNANAAGLGATGRNDQSQTRDSSKRSDEDDTN
ncbi:MAG: hypothetical protein ACXVBX_11705 [Flavisolibacter sp.]